MNLMRASFLSNVPNKHFVRRCSIRTLQRLVLFARRSRTRFVRKFGWTTVWDGAATGHAPPHTLRGLSGSLSRRLRMNTAACVIARLLRRAAIGHLLFAQPHRLKRLARREIKKRKEARTLRGAWRVGGSHAPFFYSYHTTRRWHGMRALTHESILAYPRQIFRIVLVIPIRIGPAAAAQDKKLEGIPYCVHDDTAGAPTTLEAHLLGAVRVIRTGSTLPERHGENMGITPSVRHE